MKWVSIALLFIFCTVLAVMEGITMSKLGNLKESLDMAQNGPTMINLPHRETGELVPHTVFGGALVHGPDGGIVGITPLLASQEAFDIWVNEQRVKAIKDRDRHGN